MNEPHSVICKNCSKPVKNNFCDVCGQASNTKRINSVYLLSQIQSVFNIDRGFFFTIKELLVRPGETIRNYVEGKRIRYFKPFSFTFLAATIYALLVLIFGDKIVNLVNDGIADSMVDYTDGEMHDFDPEAYKQTVQQSMEVVYSYYGAFTLLTVPLYSLATFFLFKKEGYNYAEHMVINAYIVGLQIIICFFALPFANSYWGISVYAFAILFTIRMYMQVFIKTLKGSRFFRVLLTIVFPYLLILLLSAIVGVVIGIIYFKLKGYPIG
ncbi:MAG: DUF3667 domain-containing protein [Prevotellaceae bacterium]|jgi:hypothetical protein|nr:DUF3667 domain-containing protein [Prevotellaceae bacterium]